MIVPKECPKCGSLAVHTETGVEVSRYFFDGIKIDEDRMSLPRRIICDKCFNDVFGEAFSNRDNRQKGSEEALK